MDGLTLRAEDLGLSDEALERVKAGEPVVITRGGEPVAHVVVPQLSAQPNLTEAERKALWAEIDAGREALRAEGLFLTQADIRNMRDDFGSDDD